MIRKSLLALTMLSAAMASVSQAAIVTVLDSGSAQIGVLLDSSDFSILNTQFFANASLGVVDTSGPTVLSLVLATDEGAPTHGYSILNSSLTELGFLVFDIGTASILGTTYTANATFSGGPFTDPGLQALVGEHEAIFQLSQVIPGGDTTVAIYDFDSMVKIEEVPEPGTFLLLGCGATVLGILRRQIA